MITIFGKDSGRLTRLEANVDKAFDSRVPNYIELHDFDWEFPDGKLCDTVIMTIANRDARSHGLCRKQEAPFIPSDPDILPTSRRLTISARAFEQNKKAEVQQKTAVLIQTQLLFLLLQKTTSKNTRLPNLCSNLSLSRAVTSIPNG